MTRMTGYGVGFFFFWLVAAISSAVSVYLIRTSHLSDRDQGRPAMNDAAARYAESLYAKRVKIHAREVEGFFENLRNGAAVIVLLGGYYARPLAALGRPPGRALRSAGPQVPHLRA